MQVALTAALGTPMHVAHAGPNLVGGGGGGSGCSCMLVHLVHPTPTCANAGPEHLQLALVVFFLPSTGAYTPLGTHCGHHPLQLALVVFSPNHWCKQFNCTSVTGTVVAV